MLVLRARYTNHTNHTNNTLKHKKKNTYNLPTWWKSAIRTSHHLPPVHGRARRPLVPAPRLLKGTMISFCRALESGMVSCLASFAWWYTYALHDLHSKEIAGKCTGELKRMREGRIPLMLRCSGCGSGRVYRWDHVVDRICMHHAIRARTRTGAPVQAGTRVDRLSYTTRVAVADIRRRLPGGVAVLLFCCSAGCLLNGHPLSPGGVPRTDVCPKQPNRNVGGNRSAWFCR